MLIISLLIIDWKINILFIFLTFTSYLIIAIFQRETFENVNNFEYKYFARKINRETIGSIRDIIIYKNLDFLKRIIKRLIFQRNAKANNYFVLTTKIFSEPLAIIIFWG